MHMDTAADTPGSISTTHAHEHTPVATAMGCSAAAPRVMLPVRLPAVMAGRRRRSCMAMVAVVEV